MTMEFIGENYSELKKSISETCFKCGRNADEIKVVAVSKTFSSGYVLELMKEGHIDFGENKVQELMVKREELKDKNINWHLIGHLQTNKVKYIIDFVTLIQSVDSYKLAIEIDKYASKSGKSVDILIQINTSGEDQKSGVEPENAEELCRSVSGFENIKLRGLMTIGMFTDNEEIIRDNFRTLKNIYDNLKTGFKNFDILSMGMTSDYCIAIEEGANMLRIGSAIFGNR